MVFTTWPPINSLPRSRDNGWGRGINPPPLFGDNMDEVSTAALSQQISDLKNQMTATTVIIAHIQETGDATRADIAEMRKEHNSIQARNSQRLGTIDQWRATVTEWRRSHMDQHEDLKKKSDRLDILNGFLATIASGIAFFIGSNK